MKRRIPMSDVFDNVGKALLRESLRVDEHTPEERKQIEKYLGTPIKTRTVPFKKKPKPTRPLEIDINFPTSYAIDFEPLKVQRPYDAKLKTSTGLAKILEVDDE
jgi:hypothetical protein